MKGQTQTELGKAVRDGCEARFGTGSVGIKQFSSRDVLESNPAGNAEKPVRRTGSSSTSTQMAILKRLDGRFGLGGIGWNNLGFAYDALNLQGDAFDAYRKSIFRNPGNISSLRAACYLAIETAHDRDAFSHCEAFQTKTPDRAESAIWFAISAAVDGRGICHRSC